MLTTSARFAATFALFALVLPAVARAGDADSTAAAAALFDTDRPDITNAAARLEPGHVQVETGWSRTTADPVVLTSLGDALLRIGVTPAFEFRVMTPGRERLRDVGFSDDEWGEAGVGFKLGNTSPSGNAAALIASIATPVEVHGSRTTDAEAVFAQDWNWKDGGVSMNLGLHHVSGDGFSSTAYLTSLSVGPQISRRVGMFFEIATEWEHRGELTWSTFVDAGASFAVARHFQLDASAGFDPGGSSTVGAGISKRW